MKAKFFIFITVCMFIFFPAESKRKGPITGPCSQSGYSTWRSGIFVFNKIFFYDCSCKDQEGKPIDDCVAEEPQM